MNKAVTGDWSIQQLDQSYAEQVAFLHQHALAEDVLPALGHRFLLRYYQYVFSNGSQVILGAISGDKLLGYCQLSFRSISVAAIIKSNPFVLMRLLWLGLTRPVLFVRGLLAAYAHPNVIAEAPEISFIAVHSTFQGQGIGKQLILEAGHVARKRGCTNLTTKTANENARSIYEKLFAAQVVATPSFLGKSYWYLSWPVNRARDRER